TGFTLLIGWLIAVGFTTVYATRTLNDFREESTVVEEQPLEPYPVFHLTRNDMTVIRLQRDSADRISSIRQRAVVRNRNILEGQSRMYMRIVKVDSLQAPSLTYEYSAHGVTYERAAERAGKSDYDFQQQGDTLLFGSHFRIANDDLMRDQRVYLKLNIPTGARLIIDRDLQRHIWDLPFNQCEENYGYSDRPNKTEWVMTASGLKCAIAPPTPEETDVVIDTAGRLVDSLPATN